MRRVERVFRRIGQKGIWDTVSLLCHVGIRALDYYLNPLSKRNSEFEPPDNEKIRSDLEAVGVTVIPYRIDTPDFHIWLREANFSTEYAIWYGGSFDEKALEHYVGA